MEAGSEMCHKLDGINNMVQSGLRTCQMYAMSHNISYVHSVNVIFAPNFLKNRGLVTLKLSCH